MTRFLKKRMTLLLIILFWLISISLFLFLFTRKDEESTDSFVVKFKTSDIITVKNTLPVSDELGKKYYGEEDSSGIYGYVEFSIENKDEISHPYEIYATKQKLDSDSINNNFIKVYLTDLKDNPYNGFESPITFNALGSVEDNVNSFSLLKGKLKASEKRYYRLRLWVADNYAFTDKEAYFSIDVDVR